jgi:predicted MFS family arabinose efflux permease
MFALALAGIVVLHFAVPAEPARGGGAESRDLSAMLEILRRPQLRPLYLGIFALHFIMTATFISVPQALEGSLGVPASEHWKIYLGVFVVSIAGTVPLVLRTERTARGQGCSCWPSRCSAWPKRCWALTTCTWGSCWRRSRCFRRLQLPRSPLPALLTLSVPASDRGAALGVYATAQFLGAFTGGAIGGLLLGRFGISGVFWGGAVMALGWALFARDRHPEIAGAVSG